MAVEREREQEGVERIILNTSTQESQRTPLRREHLNTHTPQHATLFCLGQREAEEKKKRENERVAEKKRERETERTRTSEKDRERESRGQRQRIRK